MDLIPRDFFVNDLFDDFVERRPKKREELKCDIYEKDGMYHVEMDAPGVKKEDINLDVENGYLIIGVTKENSVDDESKNYIRKERYFGKYERRFYIGEVDESKIKAEFKDGILKVDIPEKEEESSRKTIKID